MKTGIQYMYLRRLELAPQDSGEKMGWTQLGKKKTTKSAKSLITWYPFTPLSHSNHCVHNISPFSHCVQYLKNKICFLFIFFSRNR